MLRLFLLLLLIYVPLISDYVDLGTYIRWKIRYRCTRKKESLLFELFKAFHQIESSNIFFPKGPNFLHACAASSELQSDISTWRRRWTSLIKQIAALLQLHQEFGPSIYKYLYIYIYIYVLAYLHKNGIKVTLIEMLCYLQKTYYFKFFQSLCEDLARKLKTISM